MTRIAVLFATREGQTRRIAEHVAATLRTHDFEADVQDVRDLPPSFDVASHAAAILAASIHMGRHEREMVAFARTHRTALESMPTAFLSVSLAEAGVESGSATPEQKAKSAGEVRASIDRFFTETGFHPARVRPIAGALLYKEYGFLTRFVMRLISKQHGGDTDTTRDYEYTDWEALDRFVVEMAEQLRAGAGRPAQ